MHVLMIKECLITGVKYLCKTSSKDPYKYHGSGKRWLLLLKKHHQDSPLYGSKSKIKTTILGEYESKTELKNAGIYYSEKFNVTKDRSWANLVPERGDGGWINDQTGRHWKVKDTSKMKIANLRSLSKRIPIYSPKISNINNYQFIGWYGTPWGKFASLRDAVIAAKAAKKTTNVITNGATIKRYCFNLNTPLSRNGRRVVPEWRGKTPKEVGFDFIKKEI